MDPVTIAAMLFGLGKAGFQLGQGQSQINQAKKLQQSNYVPPAVREAEASSRMQANSSVAPGYARMLDQMRTTSANTMSNISRATTNPNVIAQGVMDSDAREREMVKSMEINNESWRAQNRDKLNRVLGIKGGYEKDSYDAYNATKSALIGAGKQNKYNAVSGLAESATYLAAINKLSGSAAGDAMNPFKNLFKKPATAAAGGSSYGGAVWDENLGGVVNNPLGF